MSAVNPFPVSDLIPEGAGIPDADASRETSQWVICFLNLDVRGREIGRAFIKAGLPTLIKSRPYLGRNDIAVYEGKSQELMTVERNQALPAVESLERDYADWGLVRIPALAGLDTKADIKWVAGLARHVLSDPLRFDDAEDPDWALFERRAAWLEAKVLEFEEESKEAAYCQALASANAATWRYVADFMERFFSEASQKRLHGKFGRVRLYGDEVRMMRWVKMEPSKYFDGYEDKDKGAPAAATLNLPPELVNLLAASATSKDDRIAALETQLAEQSRQITDLLAAMTAPKSDEPASSPKAK